MKKKLLWITRTGLMLALLVSLQWITKPLGQLVTGSCVNAVLAVSVLMAGLPAGLTVALLSPIFAFLLNIAPNPVTVPVIMLGNGLFVAVLYTASRKGIWLQVAALLGAALGKFGVLYLLVVKVICGIGAQALLDAEVLKAPMLKALPASFSAIQLVTALIGGGIALLLVPALKKALHRN